LSAYVGTFETLEEAWWHTISLLNPEPSSKIVNTIVTVSAPSRDLEPRFAELVDGVLRAHGKQTVSTVAGTLFPQRLYRSPGNSWQPGIPELELQLDEAAERLFSHYLFMLPTLLTHPGNRSGTYFSRMIAWPGKAEPGAVNQLAKRIHYLRAARSKGHRSHSASDIALQAAVDEELEPMSIQEYAATDDRPTSFPCLVHISLTVHEGRLSLAAVYRHWFLITKGLGNLLGLSRLLHFLAEQTGYEVGELMVTATKGNSERAEYTKGGVDRLLLQTRALLDTVDTGQNAATA
jgi:hypothetical protein